MAVLIALLVTACDGTYIFAIGGAALVNDCMAYRITHVRKDYPVMFRAEWVAEVSADACNGCRLCMRQCQYRAIRYSSNNKKVVIDPTACYGCGVCRAICNKKAITLSARDRVKEAAGVW